MPGCPISRDLVPQYCLQSSSDRGRLDRLVTTSKSSGPRSVKATSVCDLLSATWRSNLSVCRSDNNRWGGTAFRTINRASAFEAPCERLQLVCKRDSDTITTWVLWVQTSKPCHNSAVKTVAMLLPSCRADPVCVYYRRRISQTHRFRISQTVVAAVRHVACGAFPQ